MYSRSRPQRGCWAAQLTRQNRVGPRRDGDSGEADASGPQPAGLSAAQPGMDRLAADPIPLGHHRERHAAPAPSGSRAALLDHAQFPQHSWPPRPHGKSTTQADQAKTVETISRDRPVKHHPSQHIGRSLVLVSDLLDWFKPDLRPGRDGAHLEPEWRPSGRDPPLTRQPVVASSPTYPTRRFRNVLLACDLTRRGRLRWSSCV